MPISPLIWDDAWTPALEAFARKGGTVIVGARTGTRDRNNHVIHETPPGAKLSALCGITVEEFGLLPPLGGLGLMDVIHRPGGDLVLPRRPAESSRRAHAVRIGAHSWPAAHCYELLKLTGSDVQTVGEWDARFVAGEPAITLRRVGQGRVLYVGTYLTPQLTEALFGVVLAEQVLEPLLPRVPAGVEVTLREAPGRRLLFVLNTEAEPVELDGVPQGMDLLGENAVTDGRLSLGAYGCAVIRLAVG